MFMHVSFTKALTLAMAMVFLIAAFTIVDAAAIGSPGEPNSAGSTATDFNEKEPSSHSVKKRSPIINPLFPVKYPLTKLAAKTADLTGVSKLMSLIPGINKMYLGFWGKKGFLSAGK